MSVIERMLGRPDGPNSGDDDDRHGGLVITPMHKRDLKHGILETEAHAYPKPWSPDVFRSEIEQVATGSRCYLTARRSPVGTARSVKRSPKGRIVGHAGLWFTHDEAHVTNVAVHPDARRSGVATALMLALADEAIRRECVAWTLEVRLTSVGAQELYRNFGFVPAGVRKNYYENVEDAIVMWCHDIQEAEYGTRLEQLGAAR